MTSEPTSITRESLEQRLLIEVTYLVGDDLAWWSEHRVDPFIVARDGFAHYAVARTDGPPLIFFDWHDSFGQHAERTWDVGLTLYRDLADAVRCLAAKESMSRLLSETVSSLLRLGFLDRGDDRSGNLGRALRILAACGPDAADAVPRLIEIMSNDELLGDVQESAVATLSAIGPKAAEAVPKLIEMAELDTANARGWCLQAFCSIGPAAAPAVPLLIDTLLRRVSHDPDPFYVAMAADALGNIGAIEALPSLLQVLQETHDPIVATAVVEAIGKLGPGAAEAGPLLAVLAEDLGKANRFPDDADIQRVALEALNRIGKPMPGNPPGP